MAGRGGDPAFESLLRSTQALAQNIRQAHEQQQGPISPPSMPSYPLQPPPFQQPLSVNFQQQQGAYLMDTGSRNASVDSVLRNASIDSDLAYDGIEEVRLQIERTHTHAHAHPLWIACP